LSFVRRYVVLFVVICSAVVAVGLVVTHHHQAPTYKLLPYCFSPTNADASC